LSHPSRARREGEEISKFLGVFFDEIKKDSHRRSMSETNSEWFQRWLDAEREIKEWNEEAIRSRESGGSGNQEFQNLAMEHDPLDMDGGSVNSERQK
jgi:hypothetical protein